jgi:general stress protein YciG
MGGTKAGGAKAAATNKKKYGKDYYKKIGIIGAEAYIKRQKDGLALPRGFAKDKELARTAGALGGAKSRRGKSER